MHCINAGVIGRIKNHDRVIEFTNTTSVYGADPSRSDSTYRGLIPLQTSVMQMEAFVGGGTGIPRSSMSFFKSASVSG